MQENIDVNEILNEIEEFFGFEPKIFLVEETYSFQIQKKLKFFELISENNY